MDIKFDDAQLKTLVAEGILANLTGDQRESIISQALAVLLEPTKGNYGAAGPSPLQSAFTAAVSRLSLQLATEMVDENPEDVPSVGQPLPAHRAGPRPLPGWAEPLRARRRPRAHPPLSAALPC
jgi:hypothetical protein